jgi:L-threonylcarbamoyladenylate synthase
MERFWPGPLTLALPKSPGVPDLATAGLTTVAVRMPAHPVARALLAEAGFPLAAPSANPFGGLSPTTAGHVADAFDGGIDCVLDGGPCAVGVESSVIGWEGDEPVLLRAGGVPLEALEEAMGKRIAAMLPGAGAASPGTLPWHYAPRTPLRLLAPAEKSPGAVRAGLRAGLLWFGPTAVPPGYVRVENLSAAGDGREAAVNLFAALHRLDAGGLDEIHAVTVSETGLGRAVNDRLRKAAAAPSGART